MTHPGTPPAPERSPPLPPAPSLAAIVGLYLVVVGITVTAALVSYRSAAAILASDRAQELVAVSAFKVDQVVRWRAERLADAKTLAADPLLADAVFSGHGRFSGEAGEELGEWFRGLRATGDYVGVALTDATGRIRLQAGEPFADLDRLHDLAARALAGSAAFASNVFDRDGAALIDFVAPLAPGGERGAGAVLVRADPRPYLFRMVLSWHRPSPSAEGLLVQRAGGDAVVVSAPRGGKHRPMELRMSLSANDTPGTRAVRGSFGTGPGRDYRGVEVLAATAPVPDSPWSIVVKEDLVDVLAPLRERGAWTLAAALAILTVAGGAMAGWWRAQVHRAERFRLRTELERSAFARRIERLTRFAHDMVFLSDESQRLLEVNDRAAALLGYTREELIGMNVRDLRDPATVDDFDVRIREQLAAGGARFETRYRCKDGTPLPVEVSVHTEEIDGRRYFHGIARDIGDRKRLEAQLVLAARLASVGTLAGGVAHEINNPLAFILSNVEFALAALARTGGDPEVIRALEDTRDGGRRVRDVVRGLQAFARRGDFPETLDLREVAQAAASMVSNELRHRARLVVEAGDVPPVRASASGLGQAFFNLLVNAAQAIPEGHAAENVVRVATSTAPDGRAVLEVSDSGLGIPPELLPRIFDPFFTTRPVGAGSGLGLSTCHGIVTEAGGEITVESTVGKGTTFRVFLPPAPHAAEEPSEQPGVPATAPRRLRILVVDDEPLVGMAIARLLSVQHEVTTRGSAEVALRELLAGARYDVILCDLMMPDMTGMELHARLAELSPADAKRMIFLTGGAFTAAAQEFIERTGVAPVEKPFDSAELRERIAELAAKSDAA